MKRLFLFIGNILLFASVDAQQVINLLTGEVREGSDAADPVVKVDTIENGYLVNCAYSEAILKQDYELPDCIMWSYPGYMISYLDECPAFPYRNYRQFIADFAYTIEVIDSSYVDFSYQLAPAVPVQPSSHPDEVERLPISPYQGFQPVSLVSPWGIRKDSGKRYVMYTVYPIQYSYEQQIIRAYTKISVKITLSGGTTGIEELKSKCDASKCSFTLDGRPVKGNVKGVTVRNGQKIIVK